MTHDRRTNWLDGARRPWRFSPRVACAALSVPGLLALLVCGGCRSAGEAKPTDSQARAYADKAQTAFAEGQVADALDRYRAALVRAWVLDDPIESAHAAYNMAACLASLDRLDEARGWVDEARQEFGRGRASDVNTWLLEAKIASRQGLPDDAQRLAAVAERIVRCSDAKPHRCPPKEKGCECECVECYQLVKRVKQKKVIQRREATIEAEVGLIRAAVACDLGDSSEAKSQLAQATEQLSDVCDGDVRAEAQHVRGRIHLLEGQSDQAAPHFDIEAELLRLAGNYREIPPALAWAAEAYELAGDLARAADRRYRIARISFARGQINDALVKINAALPLAEASGDASVQNRFALLFREVTRAYEAEKKKQAPPGDKPTTPAAETLPHLPDAVEVPKE